MRGEYPMGFDQARLQECQIVVKYVAKTLRSQHDAFVALPLKADAIALHRAHGLELGTLLDLPRIERGIDVDQVHTRRRERAQCLEVVRQLNLASHFAPHP